VRDIVHGRDIKNREALANPEAIDICRNMAELARQIAVRPCPN
jgi:acetoacetyl-CoA synthetase